MKYQVIFKDTISRKFLVTSAFMLKISGHNNGPFLHLNVHHCCAAEINLDFSKNPSQTECSFSTHPDQLASESELDPQYV